MNGTELSALDLNGVEEIMAATFILEPGAAASIDDEAAQCRILDAG